MSTDVDVLDDLRIEAEVLNALWDWSRVREATSGHPYYAALGADMRVLVRGYRGRRFRGLGSFNPHP